jgi:2-methylcitrate dehydratase PrpD
VTPTAITGLAERLAGLEFDTLPAEVVAVARQRLFDTAASFVVGAASEEGRLMRRVVEARGLEGRIEYVVAATRCTELDDIHIGSCTTVGSVVVPVALLGAVVDGIDDPRVVCSLVAGYQAMTAFGRAVDGARLVYQGIWPTYLTAPFGAAAVAAVLAGLDADGTAHALAIAATRCVGMTGLIGGHATSRWFTVGCAASDGYRAACAAKLGMRGDLGVLERGFARATGVTTFDPLAFNDPDWTILDIDTKPFRVGRQALSAVQAYQHLGPAPDIARVHVWLPKQVLGFLDQPEPPGQRLRVGLQYQLAALSVADEHGRATFMRRVSLADDPRLTELYPEHWGARVEVTRADGSIDGCEVLDPRGAARANPAFGWPELLDKHRGLAAAGPSNGWLDRLYDLCREFGSESGALRSSQILQTVGAS